MFSLVTIATLCTFFASYVGLVSAHDDHECSMDNTLSNAVPPSGNFDLTSYKLNIPDGSTIVGSKLAAGYKSEWFYTYAQDGSMSFYVPSNGSDTTNAHYARSELHHLCDADDAYKYWYINDGYHRLTVTMRVDEATNADKMIIGQVFGATKDKPLIKVYWYDQGLYVEYRDSSSGSQTKIDYDKKVNFDQFTYELGANDGNIFAYINGEKIVYYDASSYWDDIGNYFKTGNYIQTDEDGYQSITHTYCINIVNSGDCK